MGRTRAREISALDLLSDVHHLLGSDLELEDLLEHVARVLAESYGALGALVWRIDRERATLVAHAGDPASWPEDVAEPPAADLPLSIERDGRWFTAVAGDVAGETRAVVATWTDEPPEGDRRRVLDLFGEHVALAVADDETRRRVAALAEESLRTAGTLAALVEATDAGFIMYGPDRRLLFSNERADEILRIPFSTLIGSDVGEVVRTVGKLRFADPEAFERRFLEHVQDESTRVRERYDLADGRIVERLSSPVHDQGGTFLGRVSVYRDVTARERLIEELAGLAEVSGVFAEAREFPDLLVRVQAAIARVVRVSRVAVWQRDADADAFRLARPSHGFDLPAEADAEAEPVVRGVLSRGPFVSHELVHDHRLDGYQHVLVDAGVTSTASVPLQTGGTVRGVLAVYDPVDGRRFEDRDVRLLTVLASQLAPFLQNAELVRARLDLADAVRGVDEAAAAIGAEPNVDAIAARTAQSLVEMFRLAVGRVWIVEEGALALAASAGEVTDVSGPAARVPLGEGRLGRAAEGRQPFATTDVDDGDDGDLGPPPPSARGYAGFAACPLTVGDDLVGLVAGYSRRPVPPETLDLIASLARHAASAITKARAFERERMIAQSLQRGLIPEALPELPGLDVAARYASATTGAEVGGDLFDAFSIGEGVALFIADVSGKGVAAASTAALVKHALRALATRETEAGRILEYLNRTVAEGGNGQFVTATLGVFDPASRRLRLTTAGHPPPIRLRADGRVEELAAHGPALGIVPDAEYDPIDVELDPHDALVMYTDGLVECRSTGGEFYGVERLLDAVTRGGESPDPVADSLVREASEFCGGSFGDDVALLVARVR